MFYEPVIAISLSIFITTLLFMAFYVMSYSILYGAIFTTRKIKAKWEEEDK